MASSGAVLLGAGGVVFWLLSAADNAARRADLHERRRRISDGY